MERMRRQSTGSGGWTPAACAGAVLCCSVLWSSGWGERVATQSGVRLMPVVDEDPNPPTEPPPVEADPDMELLRYWLELLRQLLERSTEEEREPATTLIQKVAETYGLTGLPEDLTQDHVWWSWFLDIGEVLLAAASDQLDFEKVVIVQAMIDDIRIKIEGQP